MSVYLDYNSSAPIDRRVLNKMIEIYEGPYSNPDSRTHDYGTAANSIVESSRASVAELFSVSKDEVFFTSGATESNNIAIQGLMDYAEKTGRRHIISSSIEHKAVLNTLGYMQKLGFDVDFIDPERDGRVDADKMLGLVRGDTLLVCLMHVNNETGMIQPIIAVGEKLKGTEIQFHVDATQSAGKLVKELQQTYYTSLAMSAHKLGGPQGIGALVLRKRGYRRSPVRGIMYGGQQEHSIRPGTIPVALVAGLGEACKITLREYRERQAKCAVIKRELLMLIKQSGIQYKLNGDQKYCVPNTINVCFPGVSSEALMIQTKQYCAISNGSACNSKSYDPSFVLKAMDLTDNDVECSVRFSWGSDVDLDLLKKSFSELLNMAKNMMY